MLLLDIEPDDPELKEDRLDGELVLGVYVDELLLVLLDGAE